MTGSTLDIEHTGFQFGASPVLRKGAYSTLLDHSPAPFAMRDQEATIDNPIRLAIAHAAALGTGYAKAQQSCLQPRERETRIRIIENRCDHDVRFVCSASEEACQARSIRSNFPRNIFVIGNGRTDANGDVALDWHAWQWPATPREEENGGVECRRSEQIRKNRWLGIVECRCRGERV